MSRKVLIALLGLLLVSCQKEAVQLDYADSFTGKYSVIAVVDGEVDSWDDPVVIVKTGVNAVELVLDEVKVPGKVLSENEICFETTVAKEKSWMGETELIETTTAYFFSSTRAGNVLTIQMSCKVEYEGAFGHLSLLDEMHESTLILKKL